MQVLITVYNAWQAMDYCLESLATDFFFFFCYLSFARGRLPKVMLAIVKLNGLHDSWLIGGKLLTWQPADVDRLHV